MAPTRLGKQAKIPREQAEKALELLARQKAITYGDWNQRRNGRSGRTFGYRVVIPDEYPREMIR